MGVLPYNILSLYHCIIDQDGMGMRYAFMGPMETIHLNAEGTQNYCDRYGEVPPQPISCQQNYKLRKPFFSQTIYNVSSDLGPIPTGWKQETEKDKAEVKKYKYTNIQSRINTIYRKYKVAALEATMCSTVPLEDLYKRRWSVVSATFQCISIYFCCVCYISMVYRRVWRDKRLAALAKLKRDMEREEAASN